MLIIKGVNFFPRQVEQALMEIPGSLARQEGKAVRVFFETSHAKKA